MAVDATQIAVTYSSVRMPLFTITKYINAQIATVNNNNRRRIGQFALSLLYVHDAQFAAVTPTMYLHSPDGG